MSESRNEWLDAAVGVRVSYASAAQATRQAFRGARAARCTLEEHAVLEAVVALTTLYSRLADSISVAQIAAESEVHPKNAAAALRRLHELGVIAYRAGRGRGNVSIIGIPAAEKGVRSAPYSGSVKGSRSDTEKGADSTPKREPPRVRVNNGSEKTSEKISEKKALATTSNGGGTDTDQHLTAEEVLSAFNERAGTPFRVEEWRKMIEARIESWPDLTIDGWRDLIHAAFKEPWWEKNGRNGTTTPAVIFHSDKQVASLRALANKPDDPNKPDYSIYDKADLPPVNPPEIPTNGNGSTSALVFKPPSVLDPCLECQVKHPLELLNRNNGWCDECTAARQNGAVPQPAHEREPCRRPRT